MRQSSCGLLLFLSTGIFIILKLRWQQAPIDTVEATAANRTRELLVLVYNRVPKCSSTSMYKLMRSLSVRNKFTFVMGKSTDIRNELRTPGVEGKLMRSIQAMPESGVYVRHMYNPDWRKYGVKVNLVNMVRDPISRMASWFHFIRTPAAKSSLGHHTWVGRRQEDSSWRDKDFRECVLSGDPECQVGGNRTELQLSYFCGYGPGCSDAGNVSALQMAMRAVEQEYSVVGVVEDRNRSLAVMEAFMPRWFRGVLSLRGEGTKKDKKEMVNPHPEPGEEVRRVLRERLSLDYTFYQWVRQRLDMQWKSLQSGA